MRYERVERRAVGGGGHKNLSFTLAPVFMFVYIRIVGTNDDIFYFPFLLYCV